MLTKEEIITKTKALNLPDQEFVLFGSIPLALFGIRGTSDIDIFATEKLYDKLLADGWAEVQKESGHKMLQKGIFEIGKVWEFGVYNPKFEDVRDTAVPFEGVLVASLDEVKKWKKAYGREKDKNDISLIEEFEGNHK